MSSMVRKSVAELIGTAVLVFFAVGAAVFGGDRVGVVGVALAFGFVLLALAYAIGPVSGCHVNPAVTLGVLLRHGISPKEAGAHVLGLTDHWRHHRRRRDLVAPHCGGRPRPDRE